MCSSTQLAGHTFVDAIVFADYSETGGQYTAANGERRQWMRCTGCGNVDSRLVDDSPRNTLEGKVALEFEEWHNC